MLNGKGLPSTEEAARLLGGDVAGPNQVLCPGPGHSSKDRSLSVRFSSDAPDGFIIHSFAEARTPASVGRARDYVREKLGLPAWQPRSGKTKRTKLTIVAVYPYFDEQGTLLFQVVRCAPKKFLGRRPDGSGDWIWNTHGVRIVPYRLPELLEAIANETSVFVVEGEKDADNLAKLGIIATCNAGGAGKWKKEHAAHFKGADVIIISDNDDPGRQHAESVAASLAAIAARVRVLTLPDLPPKGDVSDWIEAGGTAEELWRLTLHQAMEYKAPVQEAGQRQPREATQNTWKQEAWPDPVDGATLANKLADAYGGFVVLPEHGATTVALWTIYTHVFDAFSVSPILAVESPEKRWARRPSWSCWNCWRSAAT